MTPHIRLLPCHYVLTCMSQIQEEAPHFPTPTLTHHTEPGDSFICPKRVGGGAEVASRVIQ